MNVTQTKYEKHKNIISRIYLQILNRKPDEKGLKYYIDKLNNGTHIQQIIYQIKHSKEYMNKNKISPSINTEIKSKVTLPSPPVPHLQENDTALFNKYVMKAKKYFEFGSGMSTLYVGNFPNIESVISIENNMKWFKQIKTASENNTKIQIFYIDTNSKNTEWGRPSAINIEKFKKYYMSYKPIYDCDLIMIDGRFRVSCCLDLYDKINDSTIIFFDDFNNRKYYSDVLKYYNVIELGDRAIVLQRKQPNNKYELVNDIKKYQIDSR